ncbi:MAG: ABC transporter permease [Clostridia bacterium]
MNKQKTPFLRVVKRDSINKKKLIFIYFSAIISALSIGAILLLSLDVNPIEFYRDMLTVGMINNPNPLKCIENLIKLFVPLLITSVALSMSFKMRFWNIGGEGQFIVGAIAASTIAYKMGNSIPSFFLLILMAVCGMLAAGIYGGLVAVLKVKFGTNETLITLMLNYVALYLLFYLGETKADWNFFLNPESMRPLFAPFPAAAAMPIIKIGDFSLNISLIIALLICVLVYIYLKYTKHGYEISVVGDSAGTAQYAGMKVNKIVVRTMFISAALIGLSGTFYVSTSSILSTSVTNNVGWNGIIVAWLSKLNTFGIIATTLLISILQYGCQNASVQFSGLDSHFADLLQGIILFSVLIADFLIRFRVIARKNKESEA